MAFDNEKIQDRKSEKSSEHDVLKFLLPKWLKEDKDNPRRKEKEKEWDQIAKFYSGNLPPKNFPWKGASNINYVITELFVDGLAVFLQNFLMGNVFKAKLKTVDKDSFDQVETVEKFLDAVMKHVVKIQAQIYEICHRTAKYSCITRSDWDVEDITEEVFVEKEPSLTMEELQGAFPERKVSEEDLQLAIQQLPIERVKEEQTIRKEKATVTIVDNVNFYVPEDAKNLKTACRTTERVWFTLDQMKEKDFKKAAIEKVRSHLVESKQNNLSPEEKDLLKDGTNSELFFGTERVEVFVTTTIFTIDGKKDKYLIYWHEGSNEILKIIPFRTVYGNRQSQYNRFVFKEDGTFWGRSLGQIVRGAHEIVNSIVNNALNMGSLKTQGVILYEKRAFLGVKNVPVNLKVRPGALNEVADVNAFRMLEFPGEPVIAWSDAERLLILLERVTGHSETSQGRPTAQKKTLGEIQQFQGQSRIKHNATFVSSGESFKDLIGNILELYQRNMPPGDFDDMVNDEGDLIFEDGITKEDIQGNFEHTIVGPKGLQTQQEELESASALLELANPEEKMMMINTREVLESTVTLINEDPEKVLKSEEEILQEKVAIQSAAIQQAAEEIDQQQQELQAKEQGVEIPQEPQLSPEVLNNLNRFGG
jgi:hypothetical protein